MEAAVALPAHPPGSHQPASTTYSRGAVFSEMMVRDTEMGG